MNSLGSGKRGVLGADVLAGGVGGAGSLLAFGCMNSGGGVVGTGMGRGVLCLSIVSSPWYGSSAASISSSSSSTTSLLEGYASHLFCR